jgi:hypothetical protein
MRLVHAGVLGADDVVDELTVAAGQILQPGSGAHAEYDDRVPACPQGREGWPGIGKRPQPAVGAGEAAELRSGQREPGLGQRGGQAPLGEVDERGKLAHRGDPEHVLELLSAPGKRDIAGPVCACRGKFRRDAGSVGQRPEHVERQQHEALP